MKMNEPIIIFGTGRCGSTVFHQIFSRHDQLLWMTSILDKLVNSPKLNNYLVEIAKVAVFGSIFRMFVRPSECWNFWDHHCRGFRAPCRNLTSFDVTEKHRREIVSFFNKMLDKEENKKNNRLLIKITGWPRLTFFKSLFGNVKFIHIIRDGRAYVNSILHTSWWKGWQGPSNWRWGQLPNNYQEEWENSERSFLVLAAINWKILMDAAEKDIKFIGRENVIDIKYEDLCARPVEVFQDVCEFVGLECYDRFKNIIKSFTLRDQNNSWKTNFNSKQKASLEGALAFHLKKWGYF